MALLVKLEKYLYSSDYQFGFKPKHSTDLCIYTLTEVIEFYKSVFIGLCTGMFHGCVQCIRQGKPLDTL